MSTTETRQYLLEIALELIWQSNYSNVGVNDICSRAGLTKGAFYHHFDSKAELFCEATRYYWHRIKADLDSIFSPINSPLEQLENLISFLFKATLGQDDNQLIGCPFFNAGAQIGTEDSNVVDALRQMSETAIKYNTALISSLQAGHYLERQEDPKQIARLVYQYIHGVMSYTQVSGNIEQAHYDLPCGLYRLVGLKKDYWFSIKPTWHPKQDQSQR